MHVLRQLAGRVLVRDRGERQRLDLAALPCAATFCTTSPEDDGCQEMRRLLEEETLRFGLQASADKSAYGKYTVM